MDTLDHTGKACPIPVIETTRWLEGAPAGARVEVIVDNPTAVENLAKFAGQRGYGFEPGAQGGGEFRVVLAKPDAAGAAPAPAGSAAPTTSERRPRRVVAVGSRTMGEGDERLGATLLKGFLYALTELDVWPDALVFYNGGAHLTTEGSESLEDLRKLESGGVEVLTCGTCINHYGLAAQPAVGGVTNMYSIVELLAGADSVIKP